MTTQEVRATYLIETPFTLEYAATVMAGEQSTGTFVSVPGETDHLKAMHAAKIVSIKQLESAPYPSLPGYKAPEVTGKDNVHFQRGEVTLSFPYHNFGPSLPNLLAAIAGNLYELHEVSGVRLIDIALPKAFMDTYRGPQFGIEGTRRLTNVFERPLIGTIIKPSIGLSITELRKLVRRLAHSGIDFIKDDELNGNPPFAPLKERVVAVMDEIERAADKTGKKVMYAFNITGDIDELRANHDIVVEAGGNCVMVSVNSIGLAGVAYLRKHAQVPIHGHRNQWGAMTRHPLLGMSFTVYQKLCRLAGVDHLHTNGLANKFYESDASVIQSVQDCLTPMYGKDTLLPVLSSGQWAGVADASYKSMQTIDLLHLAGGGIMAHPSGITAGVASMQQGWEAALKGVSIAEYAKNHQELAEAIQKFG
ncbi:ribulose-bisphosphate carboxylase [Pullulanibacillus camelliae]|uniref:Ribulose-bisphosphate carboxylase n=1 Tax=Pullulanibacillus camelliae TaxID=1707096 RepID=A0A8J2VLH6_9BACL|nr:ribulose-bisphosphate carboxylase large subunit family protein [Pullulanibacillus camelliae]GGE30035.1 ribulose-bisphosphate carboxylase [Pullulanibacillus camelliae]